MEAQERAARVEVEVARAEVEVARAALSEEDGGLGDGEEASAPVVVRAPVSGVVLALHRESAGLVSPGEALLELGDPAGLEVEAEVLSADAARLRPGMAALLERWGGEPLRGEVRRVEPVGFTKVSALGVEEQRVRVRVGLSSAREAWAALGDGYRVEVSFVLWEGEVLEVPNGALFRGSSGWQVYVLEGGRARLREVELGRRSGLSSEVKAGLEAGQRVIVHPGDGVEDGVEVALRGASAQ